MLNRLLSGLAVAAVLALSATDAAAQRQMSVGISGGLAVPVSDLGDTHNAGWNAAVGLNYHVPASNLGFRFEGFYNKFEADNGTAATLLGDLKVAGGSVNAFYHLGGVAVRPYVIGGIGAYNWNFDAADESETDLGINAGAGLKFVIGGLSTFAEARLHSVQIGGDDSIQYIPIVFGVEF